ncbi:DUF934 domain-containing protein [Acidimangrovimonas sediminis]|uniref:DUF934 domain-containing protein n=1 Tax=Acidimangrovimonas sediminis TaxID=2056283 RepID=UPI000C81070B|nr:DUF934 domain-containing protein [Acidimangrovimonas sediminis]
MTILVTDRGFGPVPAPAGETLDLASDADLSALEADLSALSLIRVDFPSAADGRGFTLGRRLRDMGYAGTLHAKGAMISDQYAMARRSGFDAVEIPEETAARQPEDQWQFRADWQQNDYRSRFAG